MMNEKKKWEKETEMKCCIIDIVLYSGRVIRVMV